MSPTLPTCGALTTPSGTHWTLWAPRASRVDLLLGHPERPQRLPMTPLPRGFFSHRAPPLPQGTPYTFSLDQGPPRPDPCSRCQPGGLPGPSALFSPSIFPWTDEAWHGIPRADLVFYELHVGTFTAEGTFDAILPRLDSLKSLGITALELMPIHQFPGTRNWGYDGVLHYASQHSYGGPRALQRLVDAAHQAGLAVILDVVYNHFGPEHNYLEEFGPYLTDQYKTPWGKAVNFDGRGSDAVRQFVLDNARMWLQDFHLDGLRLDAVHAIYDMSPRHILHELAATSKDVASRTRRHIHIVGESDLNDPRIILPAQPASGGMATAEGESAGTPGRQGFGLDAQWSDDFHHALHAFLTRENRGYYADYGRPSDLACVLNTPFLYAGTYSPHRDRRHGAPAAGLPGDQFVISSQNHDQVGNRARGDRLSTLLDPPRLRLAACLLLLAPHLPLLFMGEEYGERRPFPFFCSFTGEDLNRAVREGRQREFADFLSDPSLIPLPDAPETFESARLTWSWPEGTAAAQLRHLYADLLALRRNQPALRDFQHRTAHLLPHPETGLLLELVRGRGPDRLQCVFNLDDQPLPFPDGVREVFSSESPRYGGRRNDQHSPSTRPTLLPFECLVLACSPA